MARGKKDFGEWGEMMAEKFLQRQGFKIIEKNYYSPVGELDIVAELGDDIYFIEVKSRKNFELANDLAITKSKIIKFKKTVKHYCYKRKVDGDRGMILAGIIVLVKIKEKKVNFRLAVYH